MNSSSSSSDRDPLERLAAEFLDRLRGGENPSYSEYAEKYPQWADQIREFFPALAVMEELKPGTGDRAVRGLEISAGRRRPRRERSRGQRRLEPGP
jgi:hypothetical protein